MKHTIVIIVCVLCGLNSFSQINSKKKINDPYYKSIQPITLVIINQSIYDINSKEGKLALQKLNQNDSTQKVYIINDNDSKTTIKQIIFITDKTKLK